MSKKDDIRTYNPLLNEEVQKMVWLVEERGLAAAPWEENIKEIIKYIKDYIKEHYKESSILEFSIPLEITKNIDLFDKPIHIEITANQFVYNNENIYAKSSGCCEIRDLTPIIYLQCYFNKDGILFKESLFPSLYHEFNHIFHAFNVYEKEKNFNSYNKSGDKGDIYANSVEKLKGGEIVLPYSIYRLFSETEMNAFVCDLYGELKSKDIDRFDFNKVFHSLGWYEEYSILSDFPNKYIDSLSDEECKKYYEYFRNNNISLNMPKQTITSFKNAFKHKIKLCLNKLIKKAGKIASLWFDEKEKNNSKYGKDSTYTDIHRSILEDLKNNEIDF